MMKKLTLIASLFLALTLGNTSLAATNHTITYACPTIAHNTQYSAGQSFDGWKEAQ